MAVEIAEAPKILHLSLITGGALRDSDGQRLGRVDDLIVRLSSSGYPPITGLLVTVAGRQAYLPAGGVGKDELKAEGREAVAGALFANLIAIFIIIATAATLFVHGTHTIDSAADAARALGPVAGKYAELLFGIGLLGASLLAAAILPIATSYVLSESLGFEKGVGRRMREAPVFMGVIAAMIAVSTVVAVVPGIPVISLLIGVQVVNGLLLPINLFFIWRLARSEELMGEHRNRGVVDGLTAATVGITSLLSLILVAVTVFGL